MSSTYDAAERLAADELEAYDLDGAAGVMCELLGRWRPGEPLSADDARAVVEVATVYAEAAGALRLALEVAHLARLTTAAAAAPAIAAAAA